mmetsp:Transcript_11119/g.18835  ORF Transcript_11119/g.18835 Transcript_11119/m.18835 type:complete len:300 (-) Transcript_11119:170-1069(-)|eukprot:CAMPEP_0184646690 /NCGR_PEP_ID=MMETSP0308-20130426/3429_1 /TAXON_ID=38269 /ORGANISM="Gloeochaete witrockiana, Strain SAG 46.84" /LENGTH=299 /DNA_ID=CAMNT_0027076937 /DNA_START=51 /DNA_END=953 /DNA_ORIENTATION=-
MAAHKFGKNSKAEEVADGIDLHGKVAIVTGCTSGIGKETVRVLAKQGATVVLACRDVKRADQVVTEIKAETKNENLQVIPLELASLASVRSFVEKFKATGLPLHLLINNAGIMACPRSLTEDGFESQFGVNHLGHFLLTRLLEGSLKASAPSRVVELSSLLHKGEIHFDDLMGEKNYDPWAAYNQSKLANILFMKEAARRSGSDSGVTYNAVHPGVIITELTRHFGVVKRALFKGFGRFFTKSIPQGAATTVYVATSPALLTVTGKYFADCAEKTPSEQAQSEEMAKRLWEVSEKLVGL